MQVQFSGNQVCGVSSSFDISCKDSLNSVNWYQVDGKFKYVTV